MRVEESTAVPVNTILVMPTYDWSVLGLEGVEDVAGKAARKLATDYPHTVEYDDALQEARILLATTAGTRECVEDEALGLGVLHTRLWRDLVNSIETQAKHRSKHTSYERAREGAE